MFARTMTDSLSEMKTREEIKVSVRVHGSVVIFGPVVDFCALPMANLLRIRLIQPVSHRRSLAPLKTATDTPPVRNPASVLVDHARDRYK